MAEYMLENILPKSVVAELKVNPNMNYLNKSYEDVTICLIECIDKDHNPISQDGDTTKLVQVLDRIFSIYDQLADANGVDRVKTVMSCYIASTGLPKANPLH